MPGILAALNFPNRTLAAIAVPAASSSHRIPRWFMPPVIVPTAKSKTVLRPDNLAPQFEAAGLKAGETVLLIGAGGGGVGAAAQIAQRVGARVIGFDRRRICD